MKTQRPAWQVVLAFTAVLIVALLLYRQYRIAEQRVDDSRRQGDAQIASAHAILDRLTQARAFADQQAAGARQIWDEFDALPVSQKTTQLVEAYVARGAAFAEGVEEPWATQIRVGSVGNGRARMAWLNWPDASVEKSGDVYDVLVPSKDPKACEERAIVAVTEDALRWRSWGFRLARCPSEGGPKAWSF